MKFRMMMLCVLLALPAFAQKNRSEEDLYRDAGRFMQRKDWDSAARAYGAIVERAGMKFDAASYWQAYSLSKLGRTDEALKTLTQMYAKAPQSRWISDARALEMEIRQAAGQAVAPEGQADEELKLMAVSTLMRSDPARAIPILEKVVFGTGSVRLKQLALFVIAQKKTPESRAILVRIAKGEGNPDLQMYALEMVGLQGGPDSIALLSSLYPTASDDAMRRRILQGLAMAKAHEQLLSIYKSEQNPKLRRDALHMYASIAGGSVEALKSLYDSETDQQTRRDIIGLLSMRKAAKELTDIARTDKDPNLRRAAMETLRAADPKAADELAAEILSK